MGNNMSQGGIISAGGGPPAMQAGTNHSVLPIDNPPYPGPTYECRIVVINAKLKRKFTLGLTAGAELSKSDVQNYYQTLQQQYGEYYHMFTFLQVPLQRSNGFGSTHVSFQGIFSRPSLYVPSPERWILQVQSIQIQFSMFNAGRMFGSESVAPNVQGIYDVINKMAQTGGKLICMECNGDVYSPGRTTVFAGLIYGVDVFFDVPQHPNPTIYTYTAHSTPMIISRNLNVVQIQCDWTGTLNMYLQQGWKLVDVLIPNLESGELERQSSQQENHYSYGNQTEQTLWFFEKELSLINDVQPKYQVTLVEYYINAKMSGLNIKTDFDLTQVLAEMGQKGWSLVSVLDTPQTSAAGFAKATRGVILFFQRPFLDHLNTQLFIQPNIQMVSGTQMHATGPQPFGPQGLIGPQAAPPQQSFNGTQAQQPVPPPSYSQASQPPYPTK